MKFLLVLAVCIYSASAKIKCVQGTNGSTAQAPKSNVYKERMDLLQLRIAQRIPIHCVHSQNSLNSRDWLKAYSTHVENVRVKLRVQHVRNVPVKLQKDATHLKRLEQTSTVTPTHTMQQARLSPSLKMPLYAND